MKPVSPVLPGIENYPEVRIGDGQEGVSSLPACYLQQEGCAVSRWELSDADKAFIAKHGYFYLYQWTYGAPYQPVMLTTEAPSIDYEDIETNHREP